MVRTFFFVLAWAVCTNIFAQCAFAQAIPENKVSFAVYPLLGDDQDDTDFAISANLKFSDRFSYFGFINFDSVFHGDDTDVGRSEQNLRFTPVLTLPFDINAQALRAPGPNNDFSQLGISYRVNDTPAFRDLFRSVNLSYRLTVSPIRLGENEPGGIGIEHVFFWGVPHTDRKLAIKGFYDQSFGEDLPPFFPDNPIVTEIEASYALGMGFAAVAQYRYNQKRIGNERNYALGIEKTFHW